MLVTTLLGMNTRAADSQALVAGGQPAFQNAALSQAASDWQTAVELFREQGHNHRELALNS